MESPGAPKPCSPPSSAGPGTNDLNFATLQSSDIQDVRELLTTFVDRVLPIRERLIGDASEDGTLVAIRQKEEMVLDVML